MTSYLFHFPAFIAAWSDLSTRHLTLTEVNALTTWLGWHVMVLGPIFFGLVVLCERLSPLVKRYGGGALIAGGLAFLPMYVICDGWWGWLYFSCW